MKKIMLVFAVLMTFAVSANAMGYEQARQQALFLADKMAYELNLTEEQYEAVYEINLDYLMSVNNEYDLYGDYWRHRNLDLSYVLLDWQYRAYCAATYFYRPLAWYGGYWHFGIYARYPYRDYFYFGRPHFYNVYRGGHGWHHNGGRSWYHGRTFAPRGGRDRHIGMRTHYDRGNRGGNFGGNRGGGTRGGFDHNNGTRGGGVGNNGNRGGFDHNNGTRGGGVGNNSNRGGGTRGSFGNSGNGNRSFGGHSSRESSTRTTPSNGGSRSFGSGSVSTRPSGTFTPHSSGSSSNFGGSRSFGSSRSSGSSFSGGSRSFGGSRSSSSSFGGGSRGGSFSGGSRGGSFGGGSRGGHGGHR